MSSLALGPARASVNVTVRPALSAVDRPLFVDTVRRYLNPQADEARYEWLYRRNPAGEARAWVAVDAEAAPVGIAAAFPRRIYLAGRPAVGWALGEFCITEGHRALGPALALQKACLGDLEAGRRTLCYDFPSASMLAVYARLRVAPSGYLRRFARPLRVERHLRGRVRPSWLAAGLARVADAALGRRYRAASAADVRIAPERGPWGAEFSALARDLAGRYAFCLDRSGEYLTWRYAADPHRTYDMLTARRGDALLGYVVWRHDGETAVVTDWAGVDGPGVVRPLLSAAVDVIRERGASTVSLSLPDAHALVSDLRTLGFHPREQGPVVMYAPAGVPGLDGPAPPAWHLTAGDRDS